MPAIERCSWCAGDPLYTEYHDVEWGVPVFDAAALFERLVLEGMQAGLSWITVLKKRARMREQFFAFNIARVAAADDRQVGAWLEDPGIIRHRGKLVAMVTNAGLTLERPDFADWLWSFAPSGAASHESKEAVPSESEESRAMSRALKQAGYKFVGPTICYAFMQSVGMVNDHVARCWRQAECARLRRAALERAR